MRQKYSRASTLFTTVYCTQRKFKASDSARVLFTVNWSDYETSDVINPVLIFRGFNLPPLLVSIHTSDIAWHVNLVKTRIKQSQRLPFFIIIIFLLIFFIFYFFAPCNVKNLRPWKKQLHFNYLRNSNYLLNIIDKFT